MTTPPPIMEEEDPNPLPPENFYDDVRSRLADTELYDVAGKSKRATTTTTTTTHHKHHHHTTTATTHAYGKKVSLPPDDVANPTDEEENGTASPAPPPPLAPNSSSTGKARGLRFPQLLRRRAANGDSHVSRSARGSQSTTAPSNASESRRSSANTSVGSGGGVRRTLAREERKPKKTCGRECTISYQLFIQISFTILIVITSSIQIGVQNWVATDISNALETSCQNTTSVLANQTIREIVQSLINTGNSTISQAALSLSSDMMSEIQTAVGSTYNFIVAATQNNASDAVSLVLPSPTNASSSCDLDIFLQRQAMARYFDSVDSNSIGFTQGNFVQYTFCTPLTSDPSAPSSQQDPTLSTCNSTKSTGYPNGTLLVCPAFQGFNETSSGLALLGECNMYQGFSVYNQVAFRDQLAVPALLGPGVSALGVWSRPYIQNLNYTGFNSSVNPAGNVVGISFSFPINLGCPLERYNCFQGAIWGSLTSRAITAYARAGLDQLNLEYASTTLVKSGGGGDLLDLSQTISSVLYVTDRASQAILGGAYGSNYTYSPHAVEYPNASGIPLIAQSFNYIVAEFGSLTNSSLDFPQILLFQNESLHPCELNVSEIPGATSGSAVPTILTATVPSSIGDSNKFSTSCIIVLTARAKSETIAPLFPTLKPADVLVVEALDADLFLAAFVQIYATILSVQNELKQQNQARVAAGIGTGVAIGVATILGGIFLASFISVIVTRPLNRITHAMRRLKNFEFRDPELDAETNVSRINDVARVELTFLSLRDAIEVFARFVPSQVVRGIIAGNERSTELFVENRYVTIAFTDIKGFTSISERLPTRELIYFLTRYLTIMTHIVEAYQGTVTEILGDGLLILWNAPDVTERHEARAAACALAMQHAMKRLTHEFERVMTTYGLPPLAIRVGVNAGNVLCGNIGSQTKFKYGCLGDVVNTASRLEGLCKLYECEVLVSGSVWNALNGQFRGRRLDVVAVKGKNEPMEVYEVLSLEATVICGETAASDPKLNETTNGEVPPVSSSTNTTTTTTSSAPNAASKAASQTAGVLRKTRTMANVPKSFVKTAFNIASGAAQQSVHRHPMIPTDSATFGPIPTIREGFDDEKIAVYEDAFRKYLARDFEGCLNALRDAGANDGASLYLMKRAAAAMSDENAFGNGVNRLDEKY